MKTKTGLFLFFLCLLALQGIAQSPGNSDIVQLNNPVTVQYIKAHLKKTGRQLILTSSVERNLRKKIQTDPVVKNYYEAIKLNANNVLKQPLLERKLTGRRLLHVSREMLYRMNVLSMVYRMENDAGVLERINDELVSVCNFSDWNPSHYLDVAEMCLAVAIAIDWTGNKLPAKTVTLAKKALIEKGINPSFSGKEPWWLNGTNNWNQVCNGGMIAAAIVIADIDPELAAKTIRRSLNGMPNALKQYGPDGVYPEGASYWEYGTSFSVVTSSLLRSAFGTDFGIAAYSPLIASADFRMQCVAPSGRFFNFADCGDSADKTGDITLAWFAKETGNAVYLEKEKFLLAPATMGKLPRLAAAGLVWLSEFEPRNSSTLPLVYKGNGLNPLVIFRGDAHAYYFAGKGGRASLSHGNMDAGSFIFELDGVRWAIDPGVQDYNTLEQAGFNLWGMCQDCERWSLLTKGNFGHGTLTINDARFNVTGQATLKDFKSGSQPQATFDMTEVFSGMVDKSERTFIKDSDHSVIIEDELTLNDSTKTISWAMMTTAAVTPLKGGALLQLDGKSLNLSVVSPANIQVSVAMMDPPPSTLDRKIDQLKKVELRMPAYIFHDKKAIIKVRLSSPE
ncbi:MAG: heparinase II/III domain-containing protein [Agriterribacter sp.]